MECGLLCCIVEVPSAPRRNPSIGNFAKANKMLIGCAVALLMANGSESMKKVRLVVFMWSDEGVNTRHEVVDSHRLQSVMLSSSRSKKHLVVLCESRVRDVLDHLLERNQEGTKARAWLSREV